MIVYTSGEWHVKAGRESDFERVWAGFGGMRAARGEGGPAAVLLRDRTDPTHYRSFGRWPSERSAADWQASEDFARWMADLHETLDRMESYNLEVAETVGEAETVFAAAPSASRGG